MRNDALALVALVVGVFTLGSCASAPGPSAVPSSTAALVTGSAAACARGTDRDRELCSYFVDLRIWQSIEAHVAAALAPQPPVTALPCLADGPGCPWQEAYDDLLRTRLEEAFGNPDPQPNAPLPFAVLPAHVQLERVQALRQGLLGAVADLDLQIEALRAVTDP